MNLIIRNKFYEYYHYHRLTGFFMVLFSSYHHICVGAKIRLTRKDFKFLVDNIPLEYANYFREDGSIEESQRLVEELKGILFTTEGKNDFVEFSFV